MNYLYCNFIEHYKFILAFLGAFFRAFLGDMDNKTVTTH